MKFKPKCEATGIGSVPYKDPTLACNIVLDYFPEIPYWPQLPRRSFKESMPQFFEDFPGFVLENERIYIDSERFESELDSFCQRSEKEFTISEEYAPGLHKFLEFKEKLKNVKAVKGQIIGPVSFGLTVLDENKKPMIYNDEMRDALMLNLQLKARYQEKLLKTLHPNVMTFVDESVLSTLYTPFVGYDETRASQDLEVVLSGLEELKGIHCCCNTNWPFLLDLVDIISFDAYTYSDEFLSYPKEIGNFLQKDGIIAWGIVPNDEAAFNESSDSLMKKLESNFNYLAEKGVSYDYLLENSLITPSCGLGTRSEAITVKTFELTRELSSKLREKYKL
ncbi:MAG: hypothetical protein QMD14_01870 [Candidatus Aenigmarchaeota archaeon]|nr:hypothetical protein [Candidatus Aenigmarchaeota archaeon]